MTLNRLNTCFVAAGLVILICGAGISQASAEESFPEEAAQEKYLSAMSLYDNGEYDAALEELAEAKIEARSLPRSWRKNVMKVIDGAEVGVLYEAGLASFESESFQNAYTYFERCLKKMKRKDPRRKPITKNMTKSAYMLTIQLWLNHRYEQARKTARVAQQYAKEAFDAGTKLRERLDEVHTKITMKHTDELVSQGEIRKAFKELKKDFRILPDPRFAYQLGELGMQLRAYSQAEKYFKKVSTNKLGTTGSNEDALRSLIETSKDRLVHIRSLRKRVTVRSNVPLYQVEVFRPFVERPIAQREAEDPNEGVTFELYPGRYRIKVVNPDYGVCLKENIPLKKSELEIDCDFERPPTSVSFDTTPSGTEVKVVPSTMVAFRKTPFYTELYQGSYTLLVKMKDYPETVEIPFLVEREDQQEFNFSLDFSELDFVLPEEHQDAVIKVDGRIVPRGMSQAYRVGVGTHTIEVSKPGYEKVIQSVLAGPREIKTLMFDLTPIVVEIESGRLTEQGALDLTLGYGLHFISYDAAGFDNNDNADTLTGAFSAHEPNMALRVYLGGDKKSTAKPYLNMQGAATFALSNPIQSVLVAGGDLGFGLLMDQIEKGVWSVDLSYGFEAMAWKDSGETSAHEAEVLVPLGLRLGTSGHLSFFHGEFALDFAQGTGRRDDIAIRCSQNVDLSIFDVSGFAGADLLDFITYNKDLDLVLGVGGGFKSYGETQVNLQNGGGCEGLRPQGIDIGDGRAFGRMKLRYETGVLPRTGFHLTGDINFVGGLHNTVPLIYDNKTSVTPAGFNGTFRLGMDILF